VNATPAPYRLYGQEISYFTAKVRCALRAKGLWFEEIHGEFPEIVRRTGLAFIPMLVTPEDETWQDSSDILDQLEARHPEPLLLPATPRQRIASLLVELYIDEFGLLPAMAWRWGSEARRASSVEHFAALFGPMARRSADAMIRRTAQIGVDDTTVPAIEAHTRDLLAALSAHLENHDYLLGGRMSYADCALMALLYAHLFNDYESRGLLLDTALPVVGWIDRCNAPTAHREGAWLDDDALAPTLLDVLRVMGTDGIPLILATRREVEAWAAGQEHGAELPRAVGKAAATLRDVPIERVALPYSHYMLQRVTDVLAALPDAERKSVRESLAATGWDPIFEAAPRHRVRKKGFQLELEPSDGAPRST
jgi:glutathione S-transferase